jgi:hypothetical protein
MAFANARLLVLLGGLAACEDAFDEARAPHIAQARPARARAGQRVTLIGERFGLRGAADGVWLGGVEAPVESWSDDTVLVRVPAAAGAGVHDFVLRNGDRVSAPFPFEVLFGTVAR